MALTEQEVIDRIEIVGKFRHIQVRTATIVERDGVEIARSIKRRVISPDADITNESSRLKALASLEHTPAVKAAYRVHMIAMQNR